MSDCSLESEEKLFPEFRNRTSSPDPHKRGNPKIRSSVLRERRKMLGNSLLLRCPQKGNRVTSRGNRLISHIFSSIFWTFCIRNSIALIPLLLLVSMKLLTRTRNTQQCSSDPKHIHLDLSTCLKGFPKPVTAADPQHLLGKSAWLSRIRFMWKPAIPWSQRCSFGWGCDT